MIFIYLFVHFVAIYTEFEADWVKLDIYFDINYKTVR